MAHDPLATRTPGRFLIQSGADLAKVNDLPRVLRTLARPILTLGHLLLRAGGSKEGGKKVAKEAKKPAVEPAKVQQ